MALSDLIARLQLALGDAYSLEREIPGGGMSRIFVATERSLDRQVVIKLLPPEMVSETSAARFKREIDVAAHLQHPHILSVLGVGSGEGLLYYVMPYVQGESLRDRIKREGPLPMADALRILRETADGLAFAHERGIVHRDIKPENILLEAGHAVIADFGIARALTETSAGLTGTGMAVGTPGYMSPEQVAGESQIDARADVYALAVVGYEMLTGRTPFEGSSMQAMITAHLTETPKALTTLRAETPRAVSAAIAKALAKAPDERFRTAQEFRDALGIEGGAAAGGSRRTLLVAGVAVVALLLAGIGYFAMRGRGGRALDPNVVAVAPFDVLAADLSLWRDGMVDVLSRNLDGMGPLRTVSPSVVVKGWDGRADPRSGAALGHRTGAAYVVVGQLQKIGEDSVRATLSLVNVASGRTIGSDIDRREAIATMDRLADSLALSLVRQLPPTTGLANARVSSLGTRSLPALKAFLQGEGFFRQSQWDSARTYFERAVAQDSSFALAWARLGLTAGWSTSISNVNTTEYGARAGSLNHGLGRRDSLLILVDSLVVGLTKSVPTPRAWDYARRLYATMDTAVKLYPRDPELWYSYGDLRFHYPRAPGILSTDEQTLADFDSSLALDSSVSPVYTHPIELAVILGDIPRAKRYTAAAIAHTSAGAARSRLELVRAFLDYQAGAPLPAVIDTAPFGELSTVGGYVRARADSGEALISLSQAIAKRVGSLPPAQARGFTQHRVEELAYRGHVRQAASVPGAESAPDFSDLMLLGVIPADSARSIMEKRMADSTASPTGGDIAFWVSVGDSANLSRKFASIRKAFPRSPAFEWAFTFANLLEAALKPLARRDSTEALRRFDAIPDSACYACSQTFDFIHARLLAAAGRDSEAYSLLAVRNGAIPATALAVPIAMERGRVAERLGMKREAVDAYTLVVDAWRAPDPELMPVVNEARAGLKRLGADQPAAGEVGGKKK